MAERLRTLARTLGLEDHIVFAGEADGSRLQAHYASADVFVLPTSYEGYGMVVAEALAHGLPVISTHTGAIAELVGNQAGILVPPGDVKALANALSQVLDDNDNSGVRVRERLARGARQVRDTLPTWDEAVRRMDDVLSGMSG
jgi:glycosyltransferase involved in cell wall biosynthesis